MSKTISSYILILGNAILGIAILLLSDLLSLPAWLDVSIIVLLLFLLLNLGYVKVFRLSDELYEFWGIRKLPYFLPGALTGLAIASIPGLLALAFGKLHTSDIQPATQISLTAAGITLVIVVWEELWFRGLILNHCNRYLSAFTLSMVTGLLFMLIHLLNPDIDFASKWPSLFLAGALLAILYFYYRTIWVPLGVHFGNNFFSSLVELKDNTDPFFGEDGYISSAILAVLFYVVYRRMRRGPASGSVAAA